MTVRIPTASGLQILHLYHELVPLSQDQLNSGKIIIYGCQITVQSNIIGTIEERFPMTPGTNAVWLIPIRLFVTSWMHIIIFLISSINLMFPFATLESWQRNSWMWCRKNKESKRGRDRTWRKSERREWKLWAFTGYLSFYLFCTEILLFGFVVSDIWEYEMPEWQKLMVETLSIQGPSSASASSSIFERYPVDWCLIAFSVHWLLHSDNELLGRHNPLVAAVRGLACDFWQLKREGTAPGSCSTFSLSESDNVQ